MITQSEQKYWTVIRLISNEVDPWSYEVGHAIYDQPEIRIKSRKPLAETVINRVVQQWNKKGYRLAGVAKLEVNQFNQEEF